MSTRIAAPAPEDDSSACPPSTERHCLPSPNQTLPSAMNPIPSPVKEQTSPFPASAPDGESPASATSPPSNNNEDPPVQENGVIDETPAGESSQEPTPDLVTETPSPEDRVTVENARSSPISVRLSEVDPKRVDWLWPRHIPCGKITLLVGYPEAGKSTLTADIAARVTRGDKWPDGTSGATAPGTVILLSAEDGPADTIRPRLDAAGADVARVVLIKSVRRRTKGADAPRRGFFDLTQDIEALEIEIDRHPDTRLVIIDPISAYMGKTDAHRNACVRGALKPLADLAESKGVAILAISHLNKSAGKKVIHRITGSAAYVEAARSVLMAANDPQDPVRRFLVVAKANLSDRPPGLVYQIESDSSRMPVVAWSEERTDLTADAILKRSEASPGERSALEETKGILREMLADGPVSANDVQRTTRECGISRSTLLRAKGALGIGSAKRTFGGAGTWDWTLPQAPEEHSATPDRPFDEEEEPPAAVLA